uniref:Probable LRR receptor-like serine/threonine-protein kinase RFK1 n=3 Tax=Nicotiana TaxID=4085 RepID=A0A1S4B9V2_TOBAC|nr:PREDICTED: probable LRR receptor-like serine/threonine-protein kinase RFK1 [Nicotiana sylvestris]XP_016485617.1 PREDICTED: probable LRR receptor-like serine/threonine-protein kinase RFK1 [Nicotiana tabacum]
MTQVAAQGNSGGMVMMWNEAEVIVDQVASTDQEIHAMVKNELEILTNEDRHPCLMKLKGFCFQYILAVVYDEVPTKFLSEVLSSGDHGFESWKQTLAEMPGKCHFGWNDRMKVAMQLASLFAWLHERRFAFGSVTPSGITIDKDLNIKLFDFGYLAPVSEEDNGVPMPYPVFPDTPEARNGVSL